MPAAIESMMWSKDPPWHGLGVDVGDEPVNSAQAMDAAGLNWHVIKARISQVNPGGEPVPDHFPYAPGQDVAVSDPDDGSFAVVRLGCSRDETPKILGLVGRAYHPVQNAEAFAFLDSLQERGELRYTTAGSLQGGRRVWMLAQLAGQERLLVGGEDEVHPYLLLANSHDGNSGLICRLTSVRVVCQNTLNLALGERGAGLALRHSHSIKARMDAASRLLAATQASLTTWLAHADRLYGARISEAEWAALVELLLPLPSPAKSAQVALNQRETLATCYTEAPGAQPGTCWGALQAVTAYCSHAKTTRGGDDARLASLWFRSGADLVALAERLLLLVAQGRGHNLVDQAAHQRAVWNAQKAGIAPAEDADPTTAE